jgi:hypothetical protein
MISLNSSALGFLMSKRLDPDASVLAKANGTERPYRSRIRHPDFHLIIASVELR